MVSECRHLSVREGTKARAGAISGTKTMQMDTKTTRFKCVKGQLSDGWSVQSASHLHRQVINKSVPIPGKGKIHKVYSALSIPCSTECLDSVIKNNTKDRENSSDDNYLVSH